MQPFTLQQARDLNQITADSYTEIFFKCAIAMLCIVPYVMLAFFVAIIALLLPGTVIGCAIGLLAHSTLVGVVSAVIFVLLAIPSFIKTLDTIYPYFIVISWSILNGLFSIIKSFLYTKKEA